MVEPVTLEVFTDYIWPWCYLSTGRIERLQQRFEINVQWVFFPLHPDTPPGGKIAGRSVCGAASGSAGHAQAFGGPDACGGPSVR